MNRLHLALKAEYFHEIQAGTKVEEFRLVTPYWKKRLLDAKGHQRPYDGIVLTWGYYPKRDDPERTIHRPWRGFIRKTITHPHFGPDPVEVFAIDVAPPPSGGDHG